MHQTFFNLPPATLLKAIANGQLSGIPLMKPDLIQRYLAPSPATLKGRMKRPRPGIQSTKVKKTENCEPVKINKIQIHPNAIRATTIPPDNVPDSNIFCYATLADKQQGTLYTYATGALPARSMDANQYYFIAYDYDTNYIFAEPIPNVTDETIITTFKTIYKTLVAKGHKPLLNITDNQATKPLKKFLKEKKCKWQFVEPNNHRVNAAERAIQTFKNHFIAGLCSSNPNFHSTYGRGC